MEKVESKKVNRRKTAVVAVIVAVILILGVSSLVLLSKSTKKSEPSIITTSTLEKILNVSDLSTFEAIYNGFAKVVSPDDPQKIDYYVSYDATVKAGIDFDQVEISVDDETKIISVKLPEIKITDITVDIESMDYIFINDNDETKGFRDMGGRSCHNCYCRMCVCGGDILSLREAAGATISAERAASHS